MASLTCQQVSEFLMAYLDGELDAEAQAIFAAHLAECEECVRYLQDYQATVRLAKQAYKDLDDGDEPPERLINAILAAQKRKT